MMHPNQQKKSEKKMDPNQQKKDPKEMNFFTEYGDANRYKIMEVIGKGSYGVVCSAMDTHTGEKVAIKKISDIFEHISDAARTLREVKLLRLLRHPDIVEIKRIMLPPSKREFKEIYVVFELMESDLHQVIKANDDLTCEHHQFFLYQMLRALKYMHTANVYHRDLKPKNILANANCKLKVCDFGLARVAYHDSPTTIFWTDYVAVRWYRAPELCGSFFSKYTPAIDIWSIGCIFAEILTGKPLFPGKSVVHQLDLITDLLGTPTLEFISRVQNEKARKYLTVMQKKHPVSFTQKFPRADPLALRLLQRLLAFDPKDRPTAEEALADPYFKGLAKVEREPSCQPISKREFEFERRRVTKEDIRELIYWEILEYYPQLLKDYLNGTEGSNFLYPSAVGQFRKQFAYLEEHGGKSERVISPKRKHVSLPRPTVYSSKIPPISQQNLLLCENRLTEKVSNSLRVTDVINGNPLKASRRPPRMPTDKEESLPEQLKGLCLYFSLFPSVYEYRKDELIQIWMAEGFIEESQSERMEDIGSDYFNSLHKIGFLVTSRCDSRVDFDSVFSVPTYNPDNLLYKVNLVKLSELVNTPAAVDYFAAMDGNLDGALEMTRYLSLNCKDIDKMTYGILKNFKHLRTLLLSGHGSSIKHVPRDLFLSLKNLRTLSLSRTLVSEVPSSIRNANSLRYFDLSNTPITRLPESIDSLHHLQTIKLRGCVHFLQLPKGMKKLINLRHIDLDIIRQLRAMPPYLGNLTNLQSLSAFLVGREKGYRIGELKNLNDLRGVLRISRLENVSNKEEAEEAALIDKKCLQRLELRWSKVFTEKLEEQEKILECLQPHASLKELQIQHYAGSTLPTWISSPYFAELVVLTLYRCTNCQLLPSIGQLRMLKSLSIIEMNEVKEINHQFFRDGPVDPAFHAFPKLEILEIDIMFHLKEWKEVKLGDLPSLLKLTMDSCPELGSLPSLSWLKSLKHLEFRRCPKLLSLPSDGLPTLLESFIVVDCPKLKKWCRKAEGEDGSKIYHVPSIWFDCKEVRSKSPCRAETSVEGSKSPCRPGTSVEISEDNMELDGSISTLCSSPIRSTHTSSIVSVHEYS